jgi:oligo-1,6-glucosidase
MTNVDVPVERQRDAMSRGASHGWRVNRDSARTPMQWDATPGGGFTAGPAAPWLPLGDNVAVNVAGQREDGGSVLCLCRDLLTLRRAGLGGRVAGYQALPAPPGVWAYRTGELTVLANFSGRAATCADPGGEVLISTQGPARPGPGGITLAPWQGIVARAGTNHSDGTSMVL